MSDDFDEDEWPERGSEEEWRAGMILRLETIEQLLRELQELVQRVAGRR